MNGKQKLHSLLRYIALGGIFLLPLTVFIVSDSMFFPFITGKNIFFRLVVECMFGAWLVLAVRDSAYRVRMSYVLWAVAAFVTVIGLADLFGVNSLRSFWSNFERMEGYVTILHLGAYILVAAAMLKTPKVWRALLNIMVAASLCMAGYAFLQIGGVVGATSIGGGTRVAGTLGNATYLAVYMLIHIFITLFLLFTHTGKKWIQWLYGTVIVLETIVLFQTATRGALLGLFGGLLLTALLIAFFEREKQAVRKISITMLVVLLVCGGLFFALKDTTFVQESPVLKRLSSISLESKTAQSRLILWGSVARSGFAERPILGWGQGNFSTVFSKYYDPDMFDQEPWFDRAHNVVFDWLIAGGMLGLLAYLSLFATTLYYIWKPRIDFSVSERAVLTGLLAGYFFHNLFVFDSIVSYILFSTILAYVHTRAVQNKEEENNKQTVQVSMQMQYAMMILVPIMILFSLYGFVIQPARAASRLVDALRQQETIAGNLDAYTDALSHGYTGKVEALLQLFHATLPVLRDPNVRQDEKEAYLSLAVEEGQRQFEEGSSGARELLAYGVFLQRIGFYDEARMYTEYARERAPKKQQILLALSQMYLESGETEKGLETAEYAYTLSPQFSELAVAYAGTLIYAGKVEQGEKILTDAFGTTLIPDNIIINAYVHQNDLKAVKALWNVRVEENPTNTQSRVSFAATLNMLGDTTGAIEELKRAIDIDPSFEKQGNILIEAIRRGEL